MSWILMIGLCQVGEQLNSSIVERFYLGWNGQSRLNKAVTCYPYSREQKHVSISDTPMLLIEINSISNMGCQKKTFLFVVRMSWN